MNASYHSGFSSRRDLIIEELSGTGAIRRKKHAEAIEASRKELLDKVTGAGADTLETAPKSARRM